MAASRRPDQLPETVRRLVLTAIPSVPHLEVLLHLRRIIPQGQQPAEIARSVYISSQQAAQVVDHLAEQGLVGVDDSGCARFQPRDQKMAEAVQALSVAYSEDLISLTHVIHDSVRRNATRFADAFKIRKDS